MPEYFLVWDSDIEIFDIYVSQDAPERKVYSRCASTAEEAIEQYRKRVRREFNLEANPHAMSFDNLKKAMDYHAKLMENPNQDIKHSVMKKQGGE